MNKGRHLGKKWKSPHPTTHPPSTGSWKADHSTQCYREGRQWRLPSVRSFSFLQLVWKISKPIYLISFLFHISYILYFIDRWIISNGNSILRYPIFTFLGHFSFPRNICLISLKVVKKSDFHCFLKITFRVHFTGFGGGTGGILCYFSSETIITCICQNQCPICKMYFSNLPNVFVQFAKCIYPICKMYLSNWQNVFVLFAKCICPIWQVYLSPTSWGTFSTTEPTKRF